MMPRPITPTVPLRCLAAIHRLPDANCIRLPIPSYALGVGLSSCASCSMPAFKQAPRSPIVAAKEREERMQVGVAGLGDMGAAVAARLIEVGHEVTVWNRTPDKTKALADSRRQGRRRRPQVASAARRSSRC